MRKVVWWLAAALGAIAFPITVLWCVAGAGIFGSPLRGSSGDVILLMLVTSTTIWFPAALLEWWKPRLGGLCLLIASIISFDSSLLLMSIDWVWGAVFLFPIVTLVFGILFVITADAKLRLTPQVLLMGVIVFGAIFVQIGAKRFHLRTQRQVADSLESAGFRIERDEFGVPTTVSGSVWGPGTKDVAAGNLHSIASATEVREIDLYGSGVTDNDLVHLAELHHLRRLRLDGTKVTDAGLVHLENLDELAHISFLSTGVTRTGAERLKTHLTLARISWSKDGVDVEFID